MHKDFSKFERLLGVHFMGQPNVDYQVAGIAMDAEMAADAQPALVTTSNSGIPAFLSTYIDPGLIEVLVAPMKAAQVIGNELKRGDWTTDTAMFPVVESTGQTSGYGDYSESGTADANVNFPQRQSFRYQVITQWGELELEKAGLAKIDLANRKNIASVLTLNKFQNKSYFFGVSGLQCYGLLNDPALSSAVTPTTKAAGGYTWAVATANEIYADVQKLYATLQAQANGLVDLETDMTLALSPAIQTYLTTTNIYNVNVFDLIKKNYPNLKIETAPEYATTGGQLMQLIANNIEGQRTADCAFTEKLRAHPIIVASSSFKQKKSQGTWGTVIYRPFLIAQMLGM